MTFKNVLLTSLCTLCFGLNIEAQTFYQIVFTELVVDEVSCLPGADSGEDEPAIAIFCTEELNAPFYSNHWGITTTIATAYNLPTGACTFNIWTFATDVTSLTTWIQTYEDDPTVCEGAMGTEDDCSAEGSYTFDLTAFSGSINMGSGFTLNYNINIVDEGLDLPSCTPENNALACADGIDNDGDGVSDCDDPECQELSNSNGCLTCFGDGLSFADEMLEYNNTCPSNTQTNPNLALGAADFGGDENFVTLGDGGFIKLGFTNNLLTNSGDNEPDLWVFEIGPIVESSFIELRPFDVQTQTILNISGIPDSDVDGYYEFGLIAGATSSIDIDAILGGLAGGSLLFDAVKITDNADEGSCNGGTPGADIDAVCALSSINCQIGAPCDDLDVCTENDVFFFDGEECFCQGELVDSDGDETPDCEDECPNDPNKIFAGVCGCDMPEPGTPCDDGNPCTVNDIIVGEIIQTLVEVESCFCAGTPINCDDENPCTNDFCDENGNCVFEPIICDDGDPCTDDFCENGECVSIAIICFDDDPCTIDICENGQCVFISIDCDDGNPCTLDFCIDGVCFNEPINCDDNNPCTLDFCIDGVCVNEPIICDDGDPCTIDECIDGECVFTPMVCDDNDPCTIDICENGQCIFVPIECEGDDDPCTTTTCVEGVCETVAILCFDDDPCTIDICENGQCVFVPIECEGDDDPCTTTTCVEGVCETVAILCFDDDPCTMDICENGQCVFISIDCDDGNPCTLDFCVDGVCFNEPINCDDNDPCTEDFCIDGVCVNEPIICDDGDPCTIDECIEGECVFTSIVCDDNNPCTEDFCENGQCVFIPINCDDGNPCTLDFCIDGVCFNEPINCDDNDPCTEDFCIDGVCVNEPIVCDDNDPCTEDFCENGQCVSVAIVCFDEDPCTMDICEDGNCIFIQIDCDDNDPCTIDFCDDNGNCQNVFVDSDQDGTCDAFDVCPEGPEPGTPCDDGIEATVNDMINDNCICEGIEGGAPPVAECVNVNVYIDLNNPDVQHNYFQRIWWIDKSELDGGSTSSSTNPDIDVRRHLNFINFDWTKKGACIDGIQNGVVNNNDKGKSFRDCLPVQFNDIWKIRKYRLRIKDEFGTNYCNGTYRVLLAIPGDGDQTLQSIHSTEAILEGQELENPQEEDVEIVRNRAIPNSPLPEISLYPNPGSELLNVEWEGLENAEVRISIINVIGQIASVNSYDGAKGHNKVTLDTDRLDAGIYSVVVQMGNERVVKMWVKK